MKNETMNTFLGTQCTSKKMHSTNIRWILSLSHFTYQVKLETHVKFYNKQQGIGKSSRQIIDWGPTLIPCHPI